MQTNPPKSKEEALGVTSVWWDITTCPVPNDVVARRIGPFIKGSLRKLGYSGPLTIIAIGILTEMSPFTLLDLFSTGVALYHVSSKNILCSLGMWLNDNPPTANVMVISRDGIYDGYLEVNCSRYNTLRAIDAKPPTPSIFNGFRSRVLCYPWESLLANIQANPKALSEEECSGTLEPALYCQSCDFVPLGFQSLVNHLNTKQHALEDLCRCPGGLNAAHESKGMDADAIRGVLKRLRETPVKIQREEEEEEEEEEYEYEPKKMKMSAKNIGSGSSKNRDHFESPNLPSSSPER